MALVLTNSRAIKSHMSLLLKQEKPTEFVEAISGAVLDSDQSIEDYGDAGTVEPMTMERGKPRSTDFQDLTWAIKNEFQSTGFRVTYAERKFNKIGAVDKKTELAQQRYNSGWAKILSDLINRGDVLIGPDGKAFFAANHELGKSGVQSNILSESAAAPAAPTSSEFEVALFSAMQRVNSYLDSAAEPMNDGVSSYVLMLPNIAAFKRAAQAVLNVTFLATGESNVLATVNDVKFKVETNSRLNWTDSFGLFADDGSSFIRQEVEGSLIDIEGQGSTFYKENKRQERYTIGAYRNAGYNAWTSALKVQFS